MSNPSPSPGRPIPATDCFDRDEYGITGYAIPAHFRCGVGCCDISMSDDGECWEHGRIAKCSACDKFCQIGDITALSGPTQVCPECLADIREDERRLADEQYTRIAAASALRAYHRVVLQRAERREVAA